MVNREANHDLLQGMSMLEKVANFCVLIGEEATVKIFKTCLKI